MSLQAELDREEQTLVEYPEVRSERAWSRSRVGNAALSADAGTEFVRARMPAPHPDPPPDPRTVHPPPVHGDAHRNHGDPKKSRRPGLFRRGPLALALALPLVLATATGGYLYWDYARHFQ